MGAIGCKEVAAEQSQWHLLLLRSVSLTSGVGSSDIWGFIAAIARKVSEAAAII